MAQTLEWPMRVQGSLNARIHWRVRAKHARHERGLAKLLCQSKLKRPSMKLLPLTIRLTRIAPRVLDDDNLATAFKAVRDGIADWLGINDGDATRVLWRYAQEKGKPRQYAVRVEVMP